MYPFRSSFFRRNALLVYSNVYLIFSWGNFFASAPFSCSVDSETEVHLCLSVKDFQGITQGQPAFFADPMTFHGTGGSHFLEVQLRLD